MKKLDGLLNRIRIVSRIKRKTYEKDLLPFVAQRLGGGVGVGKGYSWRPQLQRANTGGNPGPGPKKGERTKSRIDTDVQLPANPGSSALQKARPIHKGQEGEVDGGAVWAEQTPVFLRFPRMDLTTHTRPLVGALTEH